MMEAFSSASAKRTESSGFNFLEAVLRERPDLREKIESGEMRAETDKSGNNAAIIFIGDEVFKAPRLKKVTQASSARDEAESIKRVNRNIIAAFEKEIEALQNLKGSGLPVPKVTYVGKETLFFAMTRVPGVTYEALTATTPLTMEQKQALAHDLIDFTIRMALTLPMEDGGYAKHSDLHRRNILLDSKTKKLTGVIDFGRIFYFSKQKLDHIGLDDEITKMGKEEFARRKFEIADPPQAKRVHFSAI